MLKHVFMKDPNGFFFAVHGVWVRVARREGAGLPLPLSLFSPLDYYVHCSLSFVCSHKRPFLRTTNLLVVVDHLGIICLIPTRQHVAARTRLCDYQSRVYQLT